LDWVRCLRKIYAIAPEGYSWRLEQSISFRIEGTARSLVGRCLIMTTYVNGLALIALAVFACNLVILLFRHPRLPRWLGGEFTAMMVAWLLTCMVVVAYAGAVIWIAGDLPPEFVRWTMVEVAGSSAVLALFLSMAMGMRRRLRQARAGRSPFARATHATPDAAAIRI
jgi:hypothetical protein